MCRDAVQLYQPLPLLQPKGSELIQHDTCRLIAGQVDVLLPPAWQIADQVIQLIA